MPRLCEIDCHSIIFNLAFVLLNAIKQFMVQSTYVTHIVVKINPPVLFLIAYYKWKASFCSPVLQLDNDYKPIKLKYSISANNIADLFHMKTFDTWNMASIRTNALKVVSSELQVVYGLLLLQLFWILSHNQSACFSQLRSIFTNNKRRRIIVTKR